MDIESNRLIIFDTVYIIFPLIKNSLKHFKIKQWYI